MAIKGENITVEKELAGLLSSPSKQPFPLADYVDEKTISVLRDIDENRNYSWIKEVWERNKERLDYIAIKYRGKEFTYLDFFEESYQLARALKGTGLEKGQTFVCVIENTPEFPFVMGAASMVGAKVNLMSAEMEDDYIAEMLDRAEFPYTFVSDMSAIKFAPVMQKVRNPKTVVVIPLENTLKDGNPYKNVIDEFYKLDESAIKTALENISNVIYYDEFVELGSKYEGNVVEQVDLNDEFTITYTSGSTGWERPKALVHKVRSYITMGRYHDAKISGIPEMTKRTTMALCKTMSDTDFMSNVSDTLMQGGILALEPINDKEFFMNALKINRPTLVIASRSYWMYLIKEYWDAKEKLPFMLVPISAGEPLSAGEEVVINQWLRKVRAGISITRIPFTTIGVAGGDSEHGGIFLIIFRSLQSKKPSHWGIKEPIGMGTYDMVQVRALREDGTYCDEMEMGQLVANSPCTMKGYLNNDYNESFFITDAFGKKWANLNTYGYIDKSKNVYVKGRIEKDDTGILPLQIQDVILQDYKNIMSCEVVKVMNNQKQCYVAHIEMRWKRKVDVSTTLKRLAKRCKKEFGDDFLDLCYIRIHTNQEGFTLLHTGKRNIIALVDEGVSEKCVKMRSCL